MSPPKSPRTRKASSRDSTSGRAPVSSQTVEFHRFGSPEMLLKPENRYIRTTGWDSLAEEVSPGLDHRQFQRSLNALRYWNVAGDGDVRAALTQLGAEATRFLAPVHPEDGQLLQVDLVTNAAELWAFPFEAFGITRTGWNIRTAASSSPGGIRGAFSDATTAWPAIPRVLFVHAPVAANLEQSLIDEHIAALTEALTPWARASRWIAQTCSWCARSLRSTTSPDTAPSSSQPTYTCWPMAQRLQAIRCSPRRKSGACGSETKRNRAPRLPTSRRPCGPATAFRSS